MEWHSIARWPSQTHTHTTKKSIWNAYAIGRDRNEMKHIKSKMDKTVIYHIGLYAKRMIVSQYECISLYTHTYNTALRRMWYADARKQLSEFTSACVCVCLQSKNRQQIRSEKETCRLWWDFCGNSFCRLLVFVSVLWISVPMQRPRYIPDHASSERSSQPNRSVRLQWMRVYRIPV